MVVFANIWIIFIMKSATVVYRYMKMIEVFPMRSARETFNFSATCFYFSGALDMQRISVHKDSISVTDHTAKDRITTASLTTTMQAKCLVMEGTELQYHKYNTFTVLYVFKVVCTYQTTTIVFMFGIGCIHIRNFFLKNILNTHIYTYILGMTCISRVDFTGLYFTPTTTKFLTLLSVQAFVNQFIMKPIQCYINAFTIITTFVCICISAWRVKSPNCTPLIVLGTLGISGYVSKI